MLVMQGSVIPSWVNQALGPGTRLGRLAGPAPATSPNAASFVRGKPFSAWSAVADLNATRLCPLVVARWSQSAYLMSYGKVGMTEALAKSSAFRFGACHLRHAAAVPESL